MYHYSFGDVYKGEWFKDQKHGPGVYYFNSGECKGDIYDGEWVDGKKHGRGKYTWVNGDYYDGPWVNDKRMGPIVCGGCGGGGGGAGSNGGGRARNVSSGSHPENREVEEDSGSSW